MDVALYPADCSEALASALTVAGFEPKPVEDLGEIEPTLAEHWGVLVVELGDEPLRRLRQITHLSEAAGVPVLAAVERDHLTLVEHTDGINDLIVGTPDPAELRVRIHRLLRHSAEEEVLTYEDLVLDTRTYQATLAGRLIDLTYMEYELLRFFVANRGRVWTREQLLSKVWGYDYFGGSRTVDVHVRRLRAKLGEERDWITTVRSVGYRFG